MIIYVCWIKSKSLIYQDKSAKLETPKLVPDHANRENIGHTFCEGIFVKACIFNLTSARVYFIHSQGLARRPRTHLKSEGIVTIGALLTIIVAFICPVKSKF